MNFWFSAIIVSYWPASGSQETPVVVKAPAVGQCVNGPAGPCSPSGVRFATCRCPLWSNRSSLRTFGKGAASLGSMAE